MKTQYFTELKFQVNDIHPENDEIVIALLGDYPFDTFQSDDGMVSAYGPIDSFDDLTYILPLSIIDLSSICLARLRTSFPRFVMVYLLSDLFNATSDCLNSFRK